MKKGANPAQIIEEGMRQEGLNSVQLVQALFCTGAAGPDVQQAAHDAGISVLAISTAYTECVAGIENSGAGTHVYVPVTVTPASTIFSIDDGAVYLSPSAF